MVDHREGIICGGGSTLELTEGLGEDVTGVQRHVPIGQVLIRVDAVASHGDVVLPAVGGYGIIKPLGQAARAPVDVVGGAYDIVVALGNSVVLLYYLGRLTVDDVNYLLGLADCHACASIPLGEGGVGVSIDDVLQLSSSFDTQGAGNQCFD